MNRTLLALLLAGAVPVVGTGCSQPSGAELARAREEAEAAQAEAAALRSELAAARAERESLRSAADLKQARLVAEGFLTAITTPSVDQAHGFCTPAARERVVRITKPAGKVAWAVEQEALATNAREATFKGSFAAPGGKQVFVVLVIKSSVAGRDRWLVDAFSVGG